MRLTEKLSTKHFILSHILILLAGLLFLSSLYYVLNIQYQKPKELFSNGPVTTPPKSLSLDLDQPEDNSLSFSASLQISGKTGPKKEVLIFTNTNNLILESKPDGYFSTNLELEEDENRITVVVFDSNGESRSTERTVYFSKERI